MRLVVQQMAASPGRSDHVWMFSGLGSGRTIGDVPNDSPSTRHSPDAAATSQLQTLPTANDDRTREAEERGLAVVAGGLDVGDFAAVEADGQFLHVPRRVEHLHRRIERPVAIEHIGAPRLGPSSLQSVERAAEELPVEALEFELLHRRREPAAGRAEPILEALPGRLTDDIRRELGFDLGGGRVRAGPDMDEQTTPKTNVQRREDMGRLLSGGNAGAAIRAAMRGGGNEANGLTMIVAGRSHEMQAFCATDCPKPDGCPERACVNMLSRGAIRRPDVAGEEHADSRQSRVSHNPSLPAAGRQ